MLEKSEGQVHLGAKARWLDDCDVVFGQFLDILEVSGTFRLTFWDIFGFFGIVLYVLCM